MKFKDLKDFFDKSTKSKVINDDNRTIILVFDSSKPNRSIQAIFKVPLDMQPHNAKEIVRNAIKQDEYVDQLEALGFDSVDVITVWPANSQVD